MTGRTLLAIVLPGLLLLASAAPAHASTTKCKPGVYLFETKDVKDLRAIDLPARTDGYAPRCLVAEAVVQFILDDRKGHKLPSTVHPMGARWDGGRWKVSHTGEKVTARQGSRKKVTFEL
jgi:hypothetical protein